MRQTLKRLTKMTIGYGLAQWAGPFISLIFTPILTRILDPSDYGIADYVSTVGAALATVAWVGLPQALTAHFNDQPSDWQWRRQVTGSTLLLVWLIGIPACALMVIFAPQIALATLHNRQYTFLFQLVGASSIFSLSNAVFIGAAQAALQVRWGVLFSFVSLGTTVAGNIVFIIVLRLGVLGMLLTPITSAGILSVAAAITIRSLIGRPALRTMGLLLRSGLTLLPTSLSGWTMQLADRLFLVYYVSATALGYYAIANKMVGLLSIVMAPVYAAWTPLALSIQHEAQNRQLYANMARYLIVIVLAASLGLGLFSTEVLLILTRPAYLPATPYIGILAYLAVFGAVGAALNTNALVGKQLPAISWAAMAGAAVNLLLNALLIPRLGVWGATISTAVSGAAPQIILYPILQKRFFVPYPLRPLLIALAIHLGLLMIGQMLPPLPWPQRLALKLLIFSVLPISYGLLGLVTKYEFRQGWLFVRHQVSLRLGLNA